MSTVMPILKILYAIVLQQMSWKC